MLFDMLCYTTQTAGYLGISLSLCTANDIQIYKKEKTHTKNLQKHLTLHVKYQHYFTHSLQYLSDSSNS